MKKTMKNIKKASHFCKFFNTNIFSIDHIYFIFRQVIVDTLDLTLLCDLKFVNLIVGCALAYVTDICLINLTPLLLLNRGFSSQTTAFILTLVVCGDFVSRIIQTIFNFFITVKSRYLVLLGLISAGIMRLGKYLS